MIWWVGIISIIFGALGIVGTLTTFNKRSGKENTKVVVYGVIFILVGRFLMAEGEGNDQEATAPSVTSTQSETGQDQAVYGSGKPVPDYRLTDFIGFMEGYYKDMKTRVYSMTKVNPAEWTAFITEQNKEGRKRSDEIGYHTWAEEPKEMFEKRSEVGVCWSLLRDLNGNYEFYMKGERSKEQIQKDEQEFEAQLAKTKILFGQ